MSRETQKIQIKISEDHIMISDRMPINLKDILIFLLVTSVMAIFILGKIGILYSFLFSMGYLLFRYFAWLLWKKIEIDLILNKIFVSSMLLNSCRHKELLSDRFKASELVVKEFEQSGKKRAMIQYKDHRDHDLILLTHEEDIRLIKENVIKKLKV